MPYVINITDRVKWFAPRSATVADLFMELPRDLCDEIEKTLAEAVGKPVDNHVVYQLTYDSWKDQPEITYIWFSDTNVYFGRRIIEERW